MSKLKIYLDVCSYNRPFDDQSQMRVRLETEAKLYIQTGVRSKRYALGWSYMLDFENSNNPYEDRRKAIEPWKEIADAYCPASDDILSAGIEIMKSGIKANDALHIACAIQTGCGYFITTDKQLLGKGVSGIQIRNPIDFVRETEDLDENR